MTFLNLLKKAEKRMEEWNATEPNKRTLDEFIFNQIFEDSYCIDQSTMRTLLKEMSAYILDEYDGRREPTFIDHLKEYAEWLLEE